MQLDSDAQRTELFGPADAHLKALRAAMDVRICARDGNIVITGNKPNVERTADIIDRMQKRLVRRGSLSESDVDELMTQAQNSLDTAESEAVVVYSGKGIIEPVTKGQLKYVETMFANDLTFCTGPAGTGKTYCRSRRKIRIPAR